MIDAELKASKTNQYITQQPGWFENDIDSSYLLVMENGDAYVAFDKMYTAFLTVTPENSESEFTKHCCLRS